MKIRSRWVLVFLLTVAQLGCLVGGVVWFSNWLHGSLSQTMRDQVLADNEQIAGQMARLIENMSLSDLREGSADWTRLQAVVEAVRLPNQGFLCVIDGSTGQLICHPDIRHDPMMREMKPGLAVLHNTRGAQTILKAQGAGWAQMPDGTHLIAVRDLERLGAKVLAHQREAGIQAAVDRTVGPVRKIGFAVSVVLAIVTCLSTAGITLRYENKLARINAGLEQLVDRRTRALMKTRDAIIVGLAKLAESRDDDTGQHLERIRDYVTILASEVRKLFGKIDEAFVADLALASSLHDIGKVGIPDCVLLKRGKLTPEERRIIQDHPRIGAECLAAVKERLGEDDFLEMAHEIVLCHHERWDGAGYPQGLKASEIPVSALIVAVADVYDALTTARVYKPAMSHEEAREIIVAGSGTHFYPLVVKAFLAQEREIRLIAERGRERPPRGARRTGYPVAMTTTEELGSSSNVAHSSAVG